MGCGNSCGVFVSEFYYALTRGSRSRTSNTAEVGQVSLELIPPEALTVNIGTRKLVNEWRKVRFQSVDATTNST